MSFKKDLLTHVAVRQVVAPTLHLSISGFCQRLIPHFAAQLRSDYAGHLLQHMIYLSSGGPLQKYPDFSNESIFVRRVSWSALQPEHVKGTILMLIE